MKLYVSSMQIPTPKDLQKLIGKPFEAISVALVPNAQDYFSERARDVNVKRVATYLESHGMKVDTIDLRNYQDGISLQRELSVHDLLWAMGGNTFCLRYEMRRSGFDDIIHSLLDGGVVYGGDSAGALVVGVSIAGIESADEPAYAEEVITEGLGLVPYVILPHVDNPEFKDAVAQVRHINKNRTDIIEINDDQAVIFSEATGHHIVTGRKGK